MPDNEEIHINPLGFREYDARWIYPKDINKEGIKNVGRGFGTQIISKINKTPRVIVGHDYRSYSEEVKKKLIEGLIETGCNIEDIGLALSPTAYFAQFKLEADAVAMVTASHNENGWTGIKMGIEKGLTHSPDEMNELILFLYPFLFLSSHFHYDLQLPLLRRLLRDGIGQNKKLEIKPIQYLQYYILNPLILL